MHRRASGARGHPERFLSPHATTCWPLLRRQRLRTIKSLALAIARRRPRLGDASFVYRFTLPVTAFTVLAVRQVRHPGRCTTCMHCKCCVVFWSIVVFVVRRRAAPAHLAIRLWPNCSIRNRHALTENDRRIVANYIISNFAWEIRNSSCYKSWSCGRPTARRIAGMAMGPLIGARSACDTAAYRRYRASVRDSYGRGRSRVSRTRL